MDRISPSVYERADEGLLKLLEKANVAALSEEEYDLYEASMKALEDEIDMEEHGYKRGVEEGIELGIEKGFKKGIEEGIPQGSHIHAIEVAQKMISDGLPIDMVMKYSGLSKEEIEAL